MSASLGIDIWITLSMVEGFIKAVHREPTELATAWDGSAAVKVVEAAYLSEREGKVVSLK